MGKYPHSLFTCLKDWRTVKHAGMCVCDVYLQPLCPYRICTHAHVVSQLQTADSDYKQACMYEHPSNCALLQSDSSVTALGPVAASELLTSQWLSQQLSRIISCMRCRAVCSFRRMSLTFGCSHDVNPRLVYDLLLQPDRHPHRVGYTR